MPVRRELLCGMERERERERLASVSSGLSRDGVSFAFCFSFYFALHVEQHFGCTHWENGGEEIQNETCNWQPKPMGQKWVKQATFVSWLIEAIYTLDIAIKFT